MKETVRLKDPKKSNYFYEEAMKTLRTNLQLTGRNNKIILITSSFPNEGKSDITFQLGREFASIGKRTVIVDADIRKSNYVTRYKVHQEIVGLSQYITGQVDKNDFIYNTNFTNLDIIFAGVVSPTPTELLQDTLFGELIEELKTEYDYVLIDTPPIGSVVDAAIIANHCDGAILVIESENVSYKVAKKSKAQIEKTGCKILGVVLNKVDVKKDKYYGKYNHYYSYEKKA